MESMVAPQAELASLRTRGAIVAVLRVLFRALFTYDCRGEEKVPESGPAVIAANHPSYLDPILLSLQVARPIRFMAWDALFKVPLVGPLIRSLGAFPVDIRKGKGREAYEQAKAMIQAGELVGIFPEGKRSQTGWMEPSLRVGAARLAWETGAHLVPVTIGGAYRAWPHFQSLPRPARIRVRFHDPITPLPFSNLPEEEALPALLDELRKRVERSLLPGVKKDLRMKLLYHLPGPWPRSHESLPALILALLIFWRTRSFLGALPAYGYLAYLLLDHYLIPQRRLLKWLRNGSPIVFLLAYAPVVFRGFDVPRVPAGDALAAVALGAALPYLYEHGQTAMGYVRGFVFAFGLELAALLVAPSGLGPHVAFPVFAAAYAWERRSVFWRALVPLLAVYSLVCGRFMGGGLDVLPHALAGLFAWLLTGLFPYRAFGGAEVSRPAGLGLRF